MGSIGAGDSPLLGSFAEELDLIFDDSSSSSSEDTMDRLTVATSAACLPPKIPERSPFRPSHNYSASSPMLIMAYAKRPLPPLPPKSRSSSSCSFSSAMPEALKIPRSPGRMDSTEEDSWRPLQPTTTTTTTSTTTSISQTISPRLESMQPSQQQKQLPHLRHHDLGNTATSPMVGLASRNNHSHSSSKKAFRRSSQKIYQLTGMEVHVMDHDMVFPAMRSSDSTSIESSLDFDDLETPGYHPVPVLETDDGGSSSRGSSWGPTSPNADAAPAPLDILRSLADESDDEIYGLSESLASMFLDDDIVRPWEPAYSQFSDMGAAGEYHHFTATLASAHSPQLDADSSTPSSTSTKKKRASLGLALSAATRFSWHRERPESVYATSSFTRSSSRNKDLPKPPKQSSGGFLAGLAHSARAVPVTPKLAVESAPPRPDPAPPLKSAFDDDSDDDETPALPNLKEWFAHKSSGENKGHRRTSSAPRLGLYRQIAATELADRRKSLICQQQQHRREPAMIERAAKSKEKRRSTFKKSFAGIPEEYDYQSSQCV